MKVQPRVVRRALPRPPEPPPKTGEPQAGAQLATETSVDEIVAPTEKLNDAGPHSLAMPVEASVELSALANRAQDKAFDRPEIKRAFQREQGIDGEALAPVGRMHELGMPLRLRA